MKACRYCGMTGHGSTFCWARPKNRAIPSKSIKRIGKHGQKWLRTRAQWFLENPAPYYTCYMCGESLTLKETTLDHIKSRSRHPELRYELSNLAPACHLCNQKKGSKDITEMETHG